MRVMRVGQERMTWKDDDERPATGGRNKRIYVEQGKEVKRMSEEEIVEWMANGGENAFVVHDGKVVTTKTIGRLKDNTMIRLVSRLPGGGRKKKTIPRGTGVEDSSASRGKLIVNNGFGSIGVDDEISQGVPKRRGGANENDYLFRTGRLDRGLG